MNFDKWWFVRAVVTFVEFEFQDRSCLTIHFSVQQSRPIPFGAGQTLPSLVTDLGAVAQLSAAL